MKLRLSFTLKILLPYLVFMLMFLLIFLGLEKPDQKALVIISLAGMAGSVLMGVLHLRWLRRPLRRVSGLITRLTRGVYPEFSASDTGDELGELEKSLEKHVSNLKDMAAFSRSMAAGDFSDHFESLSPEDELGEALNKLKISLMGSMKESETRRREEENRTWSAQGLAKFSSLFREAEDDLQDLSSQLMKELVNYTEADMGALFISKNNPGEEPYLEDSGAYVYDREKKIRRTFRFGEGLVGRAALEKEVIYVNDLPTDYIKIRSGLGEDKPASILLVPVVLDQQVLAVMELASLGEIPSYQIEFVRKLSDALATTLLKVETNVQHRKLYEQTKEQAEALASQEKVYEENMLKLEKAHEQALEREEALKKEIKELRSRST